MNITKGGDVRVMLDLETLGTSPGSAIVAMGAVHFGRGQILNEFYWRVELQSSLAAGLRMDGSTVLWWMGQDDGVRGELTAPGSPLGVVLQVFSDWLRSCAEESKSYGSVEMWGNGAGFDNVLLRAAYEAVGMPVPWKWSKDRCYRTVKNLFPDVRVERDGDLHHALEDARYQARHLMAMLNL